MTTSKPGPCTSSALHDADSADQREAEGAAIASLSGDLGVTLKPERLPLSPGVYVNVDGFHPGPPRPILAEVFAHHGPLKPGQRHKLMADALKLVAVSKLRCESSARVMLVLTDEEAAAGLRTGWRHAALEALDVEIVVAPLRPELAARVRAAQGRQRKGNRGPENNR